MLWFQQFLIKSSLMEFGFYCHFHFSSAGLLLFVFAVFVYQAAVEETQVQSFNAGSTPFPVIWYKYVADEMTLVSH